ncbi:MAG: hypothetical protein HBSAPP03_14050 [Phycisphaerae bacterium]|nr:MAG: hypothetical protein HBSAPP03_14050 [Phycisphaerae bacterium]
MRLRLLTVAFVLGLTTTMLAQVTPPTPVHTAAPAVEFRTFTARDGAVVRFALRLPSGHDATRPCPLVVALPPGAGDEAMVLASMDEYWNAGASRGWAVVSPCPPEGSAWHLRLALAKEFLDHLATLVRPENGLIHLAGISQGGIAAFALAMDDPGRFASLTVLPGAPENAAAFARLDRLRAVPVTMYVGDRDAEFWLPQARATAARLKDLNIECDLREMAGQGHRLRLESHEVFDVLDARRPAVRTARLAREGAIRAVSAALDDFHDAAAKADEVRYFGHFAPDAVFLGTDATERWTLEQFRAFATPYFQKGTGWTYTKVRRTVTIAPGGDCAWFDEVVHNAKYGECRGTGVLVRTDGAWRIAQYNLTKPVPNDLMDELLALMRKADRTPEPK